MQVHQILPSFTPEDAIGNDVIEIRKILKSWGHDSEIYAEYIHPKLSNIAKTISEYKKISSSENILIFHFAIGSYTSKFVKTLPDKKIILYHNITPATYFIGINEVIVNMLINGRKELEEYIDITSLALGDSEYNRRELVEIGFKNTGVLPIIIDFDTYNQDVDQNVLNIFSDDCTNILFAGRLAPNKRQDDIIKIFYYYNKCINQNSRLILVGSYNGTEKYYESLTRLVKQLNLNNVYITGQISLKELLAYYKVADIFLCMSEHEGFCVPLLESMHFKVPIIAYNSTAIPCTLKNSGVLINQKNYIEIAEMINILVNNIELRENIIMKQQDRLKDFDKSRLEKKLKKYINSIIF